VQEFETLAATSSSHSALSCTNRLATALTATTTIATIAHL